MNKKELFFKKLLAISLSLMLVLTLGAFSGFSQEEEKEIRIGAIVALSGPLSQFGPDWLKAGEIAVEDMIKNRKYVDYAEYVKFRKKIKGVSS